MFSLDSTGTAVERFSVTAELVNSSYNVLKILLNHADQSTKIFNVSN